MKKKVLMLLIAAVTAAVLCGFDNQDSAGNETETQEAGPAIEAVTAVCEPDTYGLTCSKFAVSVENTESLLGLKAEDFVIENAAVTDASWSNDLKVTGLYFTDKEVILETETFYPNASTSSYMYWNVNKEPDENGLQFDFAPGDLTVYSRDGKLSFDYAQITKFDRGVIDQFESVSYNGMDFKLYSPSASDGPLPLLVYEHGYGVTANGNQIVDDPFANSFAKERVQKYYPCYILAPYRGGANGGYDPEISVDDMEKYTVAYIKQLIDEGKVDPNRVYISGESAGSLACYQMAYDYPGLFAGAVLMNGPLSASMELGTLTDVDMDDLCRQYIEDGLSVMFAQGLGDYLMTTEGTADVYNKLVNAAEEAGWSRQKIIDKIVWRGYSDAEFNFMQDYVVDLTGATEEQTDPITGVVTKTMSQYHNGSRPAAGDTQLKTWVFRQSREANTWSEIAAE